MPAIRMVGLPRFIGLLQTQQTAFQVILRIATIIRQKIERLRMERKVVAWPVMLHTFRPIVMYKPVLMLGLKSII